MASVTAAVNPCLNCMSSQLVMSDFTQRQQNPSGKSMSSSMTSLSQQPLPATFPTNLTAAWPWKAQLFSKDILPTCPSHLSSSVYICEKPRDSRWEQRLNRGCFFLAGSQRERQAERVRGEKKKKEDRNTESRQKKERKRIQEKQSGGWRTDMWQRKTG